jgi:hypothetical protein
VVLPLSIWCGESILLVSWCASDRCAWRAATRILAGVGDLMQRTGDGEAQVRYSVAGPSRGLVMLCMVYTVHKEMRSVGFLVCPQIQGRRFLPV